MHDEENPYAVNPIDTSTETRKPNQLGPTGLNQFEKFCAVLAFVLAVVLLILGSLGLFFGCKANFTLPPVLGVLPALAGWGTIRAVLKSWH